MRATRVLYVEDDPTLRGVVSNLLGQRAGELELVLTAASADEVWRAGPPNADVALLDLDLGSTSLTGVELGLRLRSMQPSMGVVIFSQHVAPDHVSSLPEVQRMGWSFLEKRADLDVDGLVEVLRLTARGMNVVDPSVSKARAAMGDSPFSRLSARQREMLSLLASGLEAGRIADELGLTPAAVRKELSRAYAILVPDAQTGTDVRTVAVLRYVRETRRYGFEI